MQERIPTKYGGIEDLKYWINIEKYSGCFSSRVQKVKMNQKLTESIVILIFISYTE